MVYQWKINSIYDLSLKPSGQLNCSQWCKILLQNAKMGFLIPQWQPWFFVSCRTLSSFKVLAILNCGKFSLGEHGQLQCILIWSDKGQRPMGQSSQ